MTMEMIADVTLAGQHYGVFYAPLSDSVYSADRVQRSVAVFESQPIDATSSLLSWKSVRWSSTNPAGTEIYVYVRTAASLTALESSQWVGPLLNKGGNDISFKKGRYIQIAVALYSSYDHSVPSISTPVMSEIGATCFMLGESVTFYTQKFQLGFKPKDILLTYNGTIPQDAMVQFAVAGTDSTDPEEYQVVTPNTIQELDSISELSDGLKILIRGFGSVEVPFVVDEFSVSISGKDQVKVNKT